MPLFIVCCTICLHAGTVSGQQVSGQQVSGQQADERLRAAVEQFEAGEQQRAIPTLEALLEESGLSPAGRSQARKYLGLGYLHQNDSQRAVAVFQDLVGDDPDFTMGHLALSYEDAPSDFAVRYFAQATLQWRQEQLQRQRARLELTSRQGAFV